MPNHTARNLFRVDDVVQLRGTDTLALAIVVDVRGDRVRVAYPGSDGQPVRRWLAPAAPIQGDDAVCGAGHPAGAGGAASPVTR